MRLKQYRKNIDKLKDMQETQRIIKEQQEYQYFGKGGVKRDKAGNAITIKKFDPDSVPNLYGREQYNTKRQMSSSVVYEPSPNFAEITRIGMMNNYNKSKLKSEYEEQKVLERKVKEERERLEQTKKQIEKEEFRKREHNLMLKLEKQREELQKKRAEFELEQFADQHGKINVKLQANLPTPIGKGDLSKKEFIRDFPIRMRSHLVNVVRNEISKATAEINHEKKPIIDSILKLKVILEISLG